MYSFFKKYKVNILILSPPIMVFLSKSPLVSQFDLSCVKVIRSGGAPLGKELRNSVKKRLNISIVQQSYGMTECVSISGQTIGNEKPGSVGVLRPGTFGQVICLESGKSLGPYKHGELIFKSDAVMKGYINNEAATQQTIDADGWLHTGDIGYYDSDGEFFVVDRLKELIKYKGFQVPPAEIEDILLQHPKVADAAVVGVPDARTGEKALAVIVKQGAVSEKEIVDYVAKLVSPPKRLHGGVIFVPIIPKNAGGKILRKDLRSFVNKSKL